MIALSQILLLTLIPVVATILGGVVASFRPPSPRVRSFVQHLAAGVVFAAVAGELLPEITAGGQPLGVVIGFVLGVGVMLVVRALVERLAPEDADEGVDDTDGEAAPRAATGLLAAVGIDILIDGLLIGVGFAAGERVGTLLVEAHEVKETPWITSAFFLGFIALYLIELLA